MSKFNIYRKFSNSKSEFSLILEVFTKFVISSIIFSTSKSLLNSVFSRYFKLVIVYKYFLQCSFWAFSFLSFFLSHLFRILPSVLLVKLGIKQINHIVGTFSNTNKKDFPNKINHDAAFTYKEIYKCFVSNLSFLQFYFNIF